MIDSTDSGIIDNYKYRIYHYFYNGNYNVNDNFYFKYDTVHADQDACQMTDYSTDSLLTGTTVIYVIGMGDSVVPMDSILTITPDSCGYTSFDYSVIGALNPV